MEGGQDRELARRVVLGVREKTIMPSRAHCVSIAQMMSLK